MKNLFFKSALTISLIFIAMNFSIAKDPSYNLTVQNIKFVSANTIEFDIYLQHTNSGDSKFNYIMGQYFFEFNPDIANGGSLTYSIVGSSLPANLQPRNPTVSGNQLRLAVNSIPSKENLPVISENSPGTLIATVRLTTSADKFSGTKFEPKFRTGPENPYTKIFTYIDNQIKDITVSQNAVTDNNAVVSNSSLTEIPKEFALMQNYPNPFNPATSIKFDIPKSSQVKISVYDITGKEIAVLVNEKLEPGSYDYKWNAMQFASGIYFYRINADGFIQTKKMALIK